ncbi:hypothetical protein FA95DRAFT_864723 [Auriscalpium vulgare]|uniref:Uncharacterized protein n=1 Tax=Auriscalpium vulgare TaxID=40419 RepID=A0ACB8R8U5_9AGAM|nr:hypothetical protein FA95DRAFT_864723 [Auriscalpium vulgare]
MSSETIAFDHAAFQKLLATIPRNPATGDVDMNEMFSLLTDESNPAVRALSECAVLESLAAYDYAALALTIVPGTTWQAKLTDRGPMTDLVMCVGDIPPLLRQHHLLLECRDAATGVVRYHEDLLVDLPAASEAVLTFVRRCIALPAAPQSPALPSLLRFSDAFLPHASVLAPFLDTLPAPFKWYIASPSSRPKEPSTFDDFLHLAEALKESGNAAYARRERGAAVEAYTQGTQVLGLAIMRAPGRFPESARLGAVLLANRAAAHLLENAAEEALEDGLHAEGTDPTYVKGYMRQVRAYELLGDMGQRRAVLKRALGRVNAGDAVVVRSMLDS